MASRITIIILFSLAVVFASACLFGEPVQVGTATLASVTPTPAPTRGRADISNINSMYPAKRQPSSRAYRESIRDWRKLVRASGVKDLESTKLAPDDIEIRLWAVPGLYNPSARGWIFSRKAGVWKGTVLLDREFKLRMVPTPLDGPPPGSTTWDTYANRNLSPQNLSEAAKATTPYGDGILHLIEVKFGKTYRREFILNDEFLRTFFGKVKSEFLDNDKSMMPTF